MSSLQEIDTITLGAGGGAYPAAFALARSGREVVMVDTKGVMSGNCLAEGCVPSKAVFEIAELRRRLRLAPMAGALGEIDAPVDYQAVVAHKNEVQRTRYRQHDAELAAESDRLQLRHGTAVLLDPHTVEVTTEAGVEQFRADRVIIATGADVFVPPIPGAELCVTSHDLFALDPSVTSLPERLVVIGGGYIGLEVACMFQGLGATVTVIEALDELLAGMDRDFVSLVANGIDPAITVRLGAAVTGITTSGSGFEVHYGHGGTDHQLQADLVLMAVGRHPVIPEGADAIGLTRQGHNLAVDPSIQVPGHRHLYAPGDVNGRSPLFHSAVRQSLVAAHNILAGDHVVDRMDFTSVPTTIFTAPEGAYVGLLRSTAEQAGIPIVESAYALETDSRAQILGETYGEIRLFFHAESLRLLGGWVVGIDAAQLVGQIGQAVAAGLSAYDLARFADQHPTAAEGISRAARAMTG
jgi:dihydrolipoamide dehydrogenase